MRFFRTLATALSLFVLTAAANAAADLGNTSVISPTDSSNGSGTCPSWSGSAAPSTIDEAGRCLQGAIAREWSWRNPTLTTTGSANAYVLTYSVAPAAYYNGQTFSFKTNFANTGTATLNVNSLGAKTIKKDVSGTLTALSSGDIASGAFISVAYNSSDDSFVWMNRGTTYSSATTSAEGIVELATTGEAETGTDSTRAVTAAGVLAAVTGKKPIWIPGGALIPRTTNGCTVADLELATNDIMTRTCNFDGAGTAEIGGGFWVKMPASWDAGTVSVVFTWAHPSTTTNFTVKWQAACRAVGNDDAMDAALGTGQFVEDTGGTTTDLYVSAETSAITCAGTPAAGDAVYFEFERHPGAAGDTMTVDAYLVGVTVYYTDNAFVEP